MGLVDKAEGGTRFVVPSDLRAQLGSQGITGVKFVLIDFFDTEGNPVPELPFVPARRYIPAAASLMKNLEESAQKTFDRLPEIAERLASTLAHVEQMLEEINKKNIPDHLVAAISEATETLKDVRKVVRSLDREGLPAKAATLIARVDKAADELIQVFEGVSGEKGVLASVQRTSDAALELGKAATGRVNDLERTLRDMGEASQAIRELAETLQKHPDMLVKGRPAVGEK
jgi:paraquat-inducible protein B